MNSRGIRRLLPFVFWISAFVAGCVRTSADEPLGMGTLALQTQSGTYQLQGTITVSRLGGTPFSVDRGLDGNAESVVMSLPAGDYATALHDGWTLSRDSADVTRLASGPPSITPNPAKVTEHSTTNVTITIKLSDNQTVVFGRGSVQVGVAVNDSDLVCGGCPAGDMCLTQPDGSHGCATPCDPALPPRELRFQCGLGRACQLMYFRPAADGSETPLYLCDKAVALSVGSNAAFALRMSSQLVG